MPKEIVARGRLTQTTMEMSGLYAMVSEPWGLPRAHGGGEGTSVYHLFPLNAMYPNTLQKSFQNAYDVNTTNVWDQTADGSGTGLTVQAGRGGFAKFVNGTGDDEYYYYQEKYQTKGLDPAKRTWFVTEIKVKDVDKADIFVGLCATIASGNIFDDRVNAVGFYVTMDDATGLIRCECKKTTASAGTTAIKMADNTKIKLSFLSDGVKRIYFAVNDVVKKTINAYIPTADLAISFGCRNGEGAANEFSINTIVVGMER